MDANWKRHRSGWARRCVYDFVGVGGKGTFWGECFGTWGLDSARWHVLEIR